MRSEVWQIDPTNAARVKKKVEDRTATLADPTTGHATDSVPVGQRFSTVCADGPVSAQLLRQASEPVSQIGAALV
jgi:hypothetical protein